MPEVQVRGSTAKESQMKLTGLPRMFCQRRQRETIYSEPEYWNSKALDYDAEAVSLFPNNHLNRYYHKEQLSVLESHVSNMNGASVLDVGCGTGRVSRYLAELNATVTGIDFSSGPLDIAKKLTTSGNPEYRLQSVFDLDDSNAYDLVWVCECVTVACKNGRELLDVMLRLKRALKPSGKLLLVEPIHRGFLHRVLDMDVREFCAVMVEAGFEIKEMTHLHFWPTKWLLAYIQWPKFITAAGYQLGDAILRLLGRKAMGDYIAICATILPG